MLLIVILKYSFLIKPHEKGYLKMSYEDFIDEIDFSDDNYM